MNSIFKENIPDQIIALEQQCRNEPQKVIDEGSKLLSEVDCQMDMERCAFLNRALGFANCFLGKYEDGIRYSIKAIEQFQENGNKKEIAVCYFNIGTINFYAKSMNQALIYYEKALKIFNEIDDSNKIAEVSNGLCCVYYEIGDHKKSIEFAEKVITLLPKVEDQSLEIRIYNSLSEAYYYAGDYQKSIEFGLKCQEIALKINKSSSYLGYSYEVIGHSYFHMEKYDMANEYYDLAMDIYSSHELEYYIQTINAFKAKIMLINGQVNEAKAVFENLFERVNKSGYKDLQIDILEHLIKIDQGDSDAIVGYFKKINEIQTEIISSNAKNTRNVIVLNESIKSFENAAIVNQLEKEVESRTKELYAQQEEMQQSFDDIKLLNSLGKEITASFDMEDILKRTYKFINERTGANTFGISLKSKDREIFKREYVEDGELFHYEMKLNRESLGGICFFEEKEIVINEREDRKKFLENEDEKKLIRRSESIIFLPIHQGSICIGAITIQSLEKFAFDRKHVDILSNLATYVAVAIENADAFQNLQKLSAIGQEVTSTLDVLAIADKLYKSINELMRSSVFLFAKYDASSNKINYIRMYEDGELSLDDYTYNVKNKETLASYVVLNKTEIFINENQEVLDYISVNKPVQGKSCESIIYIPLINQEDVIGIISVQSYKKSAFNKHHLEILRSMASYLSVALINSNSHLQLQEIGQIGKEVTAAGSITELNSLIYRHLGKIIPIDVCSVAVYNEKEKTMEFPSPVEHGKRLGFMSFPIDTDALTTNAFNQSKEIVINKNGETKLHLRYPHKYDEINKQGVDPESMIFIPLIHNKKKLGVFSIQSCQPNAYSEHDVNLVRNIASYVSVAIQNTKSYKNLSQLSVIGKEVLAQKNISGITDLLHERMSSFLDSQVFYIGLYHKLDDSINIIKVYEKEEVVAENIVFSGVTSSNIGLYCVRTNHMFVTNRKEDILKFIPNYTHKEDQGQAAESLIAVPLIYQGNIIGVISVQSFETNAYDKEHVEIMKNIASFVSTTIHNISTYKTLNTLGILGSQITSTLDLDESFSTIYTGLNTLLDATIFKICTYNEEKHEVYVRYSMEDGERLAPEDPIDGESREFGGNWAIKNRKTIHVNDLEKEYHTYTDELKPRVQRTKVPKSVIYKPLIYENEVIGLLSVQSWKKNAYGTAELQIIDSVASYTTSALQNGITYEALERTKKEMEKLSIIASETDNAIAIADKNGEIEWFNEAYEKVLGINLEGLIKEGKTTLQVNSSFEDIVQVIQEVVKMKHSVNYEAIVADADKNKKFVQTTLTPILDGNGEVHKLIAIDSDITVQKMAELEIREKNKDITDSINYAARIQNAMLPDQELINESLPNSFIYFKPRDIVSGDFYWMAKAKSGEIIVAAVDCTGHGVPGAFLTIVGNNMLNQIVSTENITEPGKILEEMNIRLLNRFGQGSRIKIRDGMDAAICTISKEENGMDVSYSGAYNSLFYVKDGELLELKANRFPIGTPIEDEPVIYEQHKIKLSQGDMLYMFSDGYPDQLGGPKGKKFMKKRFKELLLEISNHSPEKQQERLESEIIAWSGENQQVDDVLVIGIKV